jgi:hypothetical protein
VGAGARSTYEREEEVYSVVWWGNITERDHFKNPCVNGRIILKWAFKK